MRRSILTTALISVVTFAGFNLAAGAHAQEVSDRANAVSLRHTDFTNAADVQTLYTHLKVAASVVCDDQGPQDMSAIKAAQACRREALRNAVAEVNQPALIAMASRDGVTPAASQLALNDRRLRGTH